MPFYPYHVAPDKDEPIPVGVEQPIVEADDVMAAVAKLASTGLLSSEIGQSFYVRVVLSVKEDGYPRQAISVPLTAEARIPLDWESPTAEDGGDRL